MKQPAMVSVVRRNTGTPAVTHNRRLHWGLSALLPRWRAFDGRRSLVAINWTGTDSRRTHMKIATALAWALLGATLLSASARDASAGAGTAIGALAGARQRAAVGARAGGVDGLISDLVTRNKT